MEDLNFSIEEKNNWMYCHTSDQLQRIVNVLNERDNDNAKADMD